MTPQKTLPGWSLCHTVIFLLFVLYQCQTLIIIKYLKKKTMQINNKTPQSQGLSSSNNSQLIIDTRSQSKLIFSTAMEFESTDDNLSQSEEICLSQESYIQDHSYTQSSALRFMQKLAEENEDFMQEEELKITHECGCMEGDCDEAHCSCFLTPNEICVIGLCCPRCIEAKNQYLKTTKGFQLQSERMTEEWLGTQRVLSEMREKNCTNMHYLRHINPHDPFLKNLTFCTCKKSHCQKKYCLCFERGVQCGKFCFCDQCQNHQEVKEEDVQKRKEELLWERYAVMKKQLQGNTPMDFDVGQFIDDPELKQDEGFEQTMEFESPDFTPFSQ